MVGAVEQGHSDILACEMTISNERRKVVDFSYPYYQETMRFVTKAPRLKSRAFIVVKTFSGTVWLAIIITCLCAVIVFSFLQREEYNIDVNYFNGKPKWKPYSSPLYALFLLETLTGQISAPAPGPDAARLFTTFWLFFALVVGGKIHIRVPPNRYNTNHNR
jgi:uncharacterized integral membrane protein